MVFASTINASTRLCTGILESGAPSPYAFTGREWEPESGLYYYRARYYDPKIGRFISEDPISFGGGVNFYSYVNNNPVNLTDPFGLVAWSCKYGVGTANMPVGIGGAGIYIDCTSECVNGERVRTKLLGSMVGVSAGPLPAGVTGSRVDVSDPSPTPDARNLEGHVGMASVGISTPIPKGGYSYTWFEIGKARGGGFGGNFIGIDLGADVYLGAATIVSSSTEKCCQ